MPESRRRLPDQVYLYASSSRAILGRNFKNRCITKDIAVDGSATTIGFNFGDSNPDTIIGPYKLVRQIGEGGMGSCITHNNCSQSLGM
jgi:hypothetical protein